MHFLKKIFKTFLIILIIALLGFSAYRYYKLKKEDKLKEVFAKDENIINDSYYDSQAYTTTESNNNDSSKKEEENEKENDSSNGEKYVVEKKNYDGYYNQFNFDNRLLLYEGTQQSKGVKEAIDILLQDADDNMYSKPTVVFKNFGGLSSNEITVNDLEQYKSVLNQAKNSVGGSTCIFSFEYNKLKAYVNKVVITKN